MRTLLLSVALLTSASLFAASPSYTDDFAGFLPAATDVAAASADWTSDTAATAVSSTDAGQLAQLNANLGAVSNGTLLEVGSNTQLAMATTANHRVTTTMRLSVVRATSAPTGNAGDQLGFYVDDATQDAYIWHNDTVGAGGNQWLQLTGGPTIADNEWINLTFVQDYTHKRFTVIINGSAISDALGYATASSATPSGPWFDMVQTNNVVAEIEIEGSASAPTYVDEITVESLLLITADDDGTPGEAGDGGGDAFVVTQVGGNLTITVNGGAYVNGVIPNTETLTFEGTGDSDTLTIDLGGGDIPNIIYNGGTGPGDAAGGDSLILVGNAPGATLTYTPTGAASGTVDFGGNTLTFTGLEPITQTGTIADVIINDSAVGAHGIAITQFSGTQTQVTCSFESITFTNPTNSFTLNANADVDSITSDHATLLALYTAAAGALTIDGGGAELDTLTIDSQGNPALDDSPATANGVVIGIGWGIAYYDINGLVTLLNNVAAVPALDFWGVLILSLSLLICGLRSFPGSVSVPVNGDAFRASALRAGPCVMAMYAGTLLSGSAVTMWDCVGLPIVFMLATYLMAWVASNKHVAAQASVTQ
jgi:hypothetical protein